MKSILIALAITMLGLWSATNSFGQETPISPAKKALIAEIISVTHADQKIADSMRAVFEQLDRGYPTLAEQVVKTKYPNISAAEQKEVIGILVKQNAADRNLQNRVMSAIDFPDYAEKTLYPLYDKFFTEAELTDLLNFSKSATGQKMNEVMPQLFAESIRLAQEVLLPKIVEATNQAVEEDIAKAKSSLSKKPVKK